MSSNARSTRSRHSLPAKGQQTGPLTETAKGSAHTNGNTPANTKGSGQRAFMMKWLEPPVQNKPSFEEAGLVRHGVLEHMAALGSRPRANAAAAAIAALSPSESPPPGEGGAVPVGLDLAAGGVASFGGGGGEETGGEDVAGGEGEGDDGRGDGGDGDGSASRPPDDAEPVAPAPPRAPRIILRASNNSSRTGNPPASSFSPSGNTTNNNPSLGLCEPTKFSRSHHHHHHHNNNDDLNTVLTPEDSSPPAKLSPTTLHAEPASPSSSLSSRKLSLSILGHRKSPSHTAQPRHGVSSSRALDFPHDVEAIVPTSRTAKKSQAASISSHAPSLKHSPATSSSHPAPRRISTRSAAQTRNTSPGTPPASGYQSDDELSFYDFSDAEIRSKLALWFANRMAPRGDPRKVLGQAMEYAINLAIESDNLVTAYAIKVLWHHNSYDVHFLRTLFSVLINQGDATATGTINRMISEKKREGIANRRAWKHFDEGEPLPTPTGPLPQSVRDALGMAQPANGASSSTTANPADQTPSAGTLNNTDDDDATDDDNDDNNNKQPGGVQDASLAKNKVDDGDDEMESESELPARPAKRQRRGSMDSDSSLSPPVSIKSLDDSDEAKANESEPADSTATTLRKVPPAKTKKPAAPPRSRGAQNNKTTTAPAPMPSAMPMALGSGSAPASARSSPAVAAGPFAPPPKAPAPTSKAAGKKAPAKKELDPAAALIEMKKRAAWDRTAALTPQDLSAVRPGAAEAPNVQPDYNRPSTPPPNRAGRVPRAAAVAASHTISTTAAATQAAVAAMTARPGRAGSKRPYDDTDDTRSATAGSINDDPTSMRESRAGTPTIRPAKKQRTGSGLRVKNSPVKKGGSAAGMPRPLGRGHGHPHPAGPVDNDEYCSACGNSGEVVCCDSCPRSYHFECVDMFKESGLPDEWFCHSCELLSQEPQQTWAAGPFSVLMASLARSPPSAFRLRSDVQNHFEGVQATPGGDYEEIAPPPPTPAGNKRKNSPEATIDFFPLVDGDGNPVLCHSCNKNSEATSADASARPIISCSVCNVPWHLDCLDPPLAVPPVVKTWRCPLHADEDVVRSSFLYPAHRNRKVKNGLSVPTSYSRSMRNNGVVMIHDDLRNIPDSQPSRTRGQRAPRTCTPNLAVSTPHAHELERLATTYPDPDTFGRIHVLSASGIALDTMEKLRKVTGRRYDMTMSEIQADHQHRLQRAREARNNEISASLALVELSRGRTQTRPSRRASPVDFNPFCLLDSNLETADEAQLLELREKTQAILAQIGQRLGAPKTADTTSTPDGQDAMMTLDDKPTEV